MRLVDLLLNHDIGHPSERRTLRADTQGSIRTNVLRSKVVEATNVYEYCRAQTDPVLLYELPCAAPPHDEMFVEWLQRNGKRLGVLALVRHSPFLIGAQRAEPTAGENNFRTLMPPAVSVNPDAPEHPVRMWLSDNLPDQAAWNQIRWIWALGVFQEHRDRAWGPVATLCAALDEWGRLKDAVWEVLVPVQPEMDVQSITLHPTEIFLTTMNFMQCANVKTVYVEPSPQLSKKHRKRGHLKPGQDLARYHVLKLAQSGPETRVRGAKGTGSGLVGFHPVRGEFHHYGDCCPGAHPPKGKLFGKHTGRYWVPAHVRGNPERGVIDHGFEIGPS